MSKCEDTRVDAMLDFAHDTLGLKYANPATKKLMTEIILESAKSDLDATRKKSLYDKINVANHERRKGKHFVSYKVFPDEPSKFNEAYPGRYNKDDPAIECRLVSKQLVQKATAMAARCTKRELRDDPNASMSTMLPLQNRKPQVTQQQFMQQMIQMGMQAIQQSMANGGLTNLTMSQTRHRNLPAIDDTRASNTSDASQNEGQLAILDRSRSSACLETPAGGSAITIQPPTSHDESQSPKPHSNSEEPPKLDSTIEDDIDAMITHASKTSAEDGSKAAAKVSASKAKVMKRPAAAAAEWSTRPPFGSALPLKYNNCRVYDSGKSFRVYPDPKSVYDKPFTYNPSTRKYLWDAAMDFCENPSVPSFSKNQPK